MSRKALCKGLNAVLIAALALYLALSCHNWLYLLLLLVAAAVPSHLWGTLLVAVAGGLVYASGRPVYALLVLVSPVFPAHPWRLLRRLAGKLWGWMRKPGFWLLILLVFALTFNFWHPFDIQVPHISLAAEEVTRVGPLRITNTLLASWVTMLVLFLVAFLATRRMEMVPRGLQNLVEFAIESLYRFVESIAGERTALIFPTIATLFLFIFVSNWMGLLPGYLSITVERAATHGHEAAHAAEKVPLLRSAATDLNTTLALALSSVLMSQVYGVMAVGFPQYFMRFLNVRRFVAYVKGATGRGPRVGLGSLAQGGMDLFIGVLELFDEFTKVLSFSFRLFGNIFAGEVLLGVMIFLFPFVASLPFLGLELFVGFIQAFIFAVLSTAFITQATAHHGAEAEAHQAHETHGAVEPRAVSPAVEGT